MIVTIDGPAGAGKSSVARTLAERLGFQFLDTGAMYRAVAWAALARRIDMADSQALIRLARHLTIELFDDRVLVDGQDVSAAIRSAEVTAVVHRVADEPEIREHLVHLQRRAAIGSDIVTEGRDQGTVVFPDAELKIFLTATAEARAQRRLMQMAALGEPVRLEELLAQQNERDRRDRLRPVGRLMRAPDAIEVLTDGLSLEQVVAKLERLVVQRRQ